MCTVIASILVAALVALLGGFAVIYAGVYDVAATEPHSPVTSWLLETARTRSIKAHAAGIQVPPGLDDPPKVIIGVEHYAAHCAVCHGAPGVPKGDVAHGLYPQPPNLSEAAKRYSPGELFWILKNGIKMSGMPAWSDHSDAELWSMVAFLKRLPSMSEQDYGRLVLSTMQQGGGQHRHGGSEDGRTEPTTPAGHEHH